MKTVKWASGLSIISSSPAIPVISGMSHFSSLFSMLTVQSTGLRQGVCHGVLVELFRLGMLFFGKIS